MGSGQAVAAALLLAGSGSLPPALPGDAGALVEAEAGLAVSPALTWAEVGGLREDVLRLYASRGFTLAWFGAGAPTGQARALAAALASADDLGLDARDYDGPAWPGRLAAAASRPGTITPEQIRLDVALTVSAMRLASDLHAGRLDGAPDGERVGRVRLARAPEDALDLARFVDGLAGAEDVPARLAALDPPFPAFTRTLRALQDCRTRAGADLAAPLPVPRRPLARGERYEALDRLAARLEQLGDLAAGAGAGDGAELAAALARFQARHGLDPSGRVDAATVRGLNVPLAHRAEQLALAVERWRWLPRRFETPPLVVNIPEYRLHGADPARRLSMKVVVGRGYRHRTPVLAAEVTGVLFRPYWNVPPSIQREELVPLLRKKPGLLAADGYELVDRGGKVVDAPPDDEVLVALQAGALRLRQRPGPGNALGLVKLVMPNPHDVYLHDTPAQALFSRARRNFSHGCIRVERPVELAAWVLAGEPGWTEERVRAAMAADETLLVRLGRPVPVLVLYATAVVSAEGEVRFLDDVYGHDAALARALEREGARRRPVPEG